MEHGQARIWGQAKDSENRTGWSLGYGLNTKFRGTKRVEDAPRPEMVRSGVRPEVLVSRPARV